MAHILIIEDEKEIRLGLCDNLEFEGYSVDMAADGEEGLEKIKNNNYDLILLDVMLPEMSGIDLCKEVRSQNINTPILMLTAKDSEIDKVRGLELGADDYITKPFSLQEVFARIKAVLRRLEKTTTSGKAVQIGKLMVNFKTYEAYDGEAQVSMTHKEFEILKFLWEHQDQTVERYTLLNEIWGYNNVGTTRTADNYILKLRKKIEEEIANPKHILTVHGIGYKFIIR
jgi:DNA-binding response OmpR family regulator